jgi:hypothetical protein
LEWPDIALLVRGRDTTSLGQGVDADPGTTQLDICQASNGDAIVRPPRTCGVWVHGKQLREWCTGDRTHRKSVSGHSVRQKASNLGRPTDEPDARYQPENGDSDRQKKRQARTGTHCNRLDESLLCGTGRSD